MRFKSVIPDVNYEQAVKVWGAKRLGEYWSTSKIDVDNVSVEMDFNEGYACCGGRDPDCYCSFAESPSADVVISDGRHSFNIAAIDFDFVSILGEIVDAADGAIN